MLGRSRESLFDLGILSVLLEFCWGVGFSLLGFLKRPLLTTLILLLWNCYHLLFLLEICDLLENVLFLVRDGD